jgi:hypothetical protein
MDGDIKEIASQISQEIVSGLALQQHYVQFPSQPELAEKLYLKFTNPSETTQKFMQECQFHDIYLVDDGSAAVFVFADKSKFNLHSFVGDILSVAALERMQCDLLLDQLLHSVRLLRLPTIPPIMQAVPSNELFVACQTLYRNPGSSMAAVVNEAIHSRTHFIMSGTARLSDLIILNLYEELATSSL